MDTTASRIVRQFLKDLTIDIEAIASTNKKQIRYVYRRGFYRKADFTVYPDTLLFSPEAFDLLTSDPIEPVPQQRSELWH